MRCPDCRHGLALKKAVYPCIYWHGGQYEERPGALAGSFQAARQQCHFFAHIKKCSFEWGLVTGPRETVLGRLMPQPEGGDV